MKKVLAVLVSLALVLALMPAVALADATGGSVTYGPGPYYSVQAEWTAGGVVQLIDEDDNILPENSIPQTGETFVFRAVADAGYSFVGWEYYQELYLGFHNSQLIFKRVYRPSGDTIDVHMNATLIWGKVQQIWHGLNKVYDYSEDNISYDEFCALTSPYSCYISYDWSVRDKYVKAVFAPIEYTIVFHEDGGDTPVTVGYGDGTVTLDDIDDGLGVDTAAAFFAGWSLNGVDPATEVALDGSGAVTTYDVYALYTQREEHVITATAEGPGSLSAATMTFLEGDSIDEAELNNYFQPTPNANTATTTYSFDGWYNGSSLYDFSAPITQSIELVARFSSHEQEQGQTEYVTITAVAGAGGAVTPGSVQVEKGAAVDLDALFAVTPDADYTFSGWTDSADAAIVDGLIAAVNEDITVNAVFTKEINEDQTPSGDVDDTDDSDNPTTGDQSALWIALVLFALAGFGAAAAGRAKAAQRMRR